MIGTPPRISKDPTRRPLVRGINSRDKSNYLRKRQPRRAATQVLDEIIIGGLVLDTSITNIMGGADAQNKLHKSSLSLLTSGPKKTQIGARPGTLSGGYQ